MNLPAQWPELDARAFALAVRMLEPDMPFREIERVYGISKAAWSRARNGQRVSAASYLAICRVLGLDPYKHVRNLPDVSRATCGETLPPRDPRGRRRKALAP